MIATCTKATTPFGAYFFLILLILLSTTAPTMMAPVMMVNEDVFGSLTGDELDAILAKYE